METGLPFLVVFDDRNRNVTLPVGTVHVTGAQAAPLQVAEPVEQEQRVVAGTAEVAVVGRVFLKYPGSLSPVG